MLTDTEKRVVAFAARETSSIQGYDRMTEELLAIIARLQKPDVVLAEAERLMADARVVDIGHVAPESCGECVYSECPDDARWSVFVMDRDSGDAEPLPGLFKTWPEMYAALTSDAATREGETKSWLRETLDDAEQRRADGKIHVSERVEQEIESIRKEPKT